MAALESKHRSEMAALDRSSHGVDCRRPLELGVLGDDPAGDVDLLELDARVARLAGDCTVRLVGRVTALAGNVHRPELPADVSRLEPREIRHPGGVTAKIIRLHIHRMRSVLPNPPWQVVMPIDDRLHRED